MKVLYLIFSHDHQPQVARLALIIRRLSPSAEIVIHHDPSLSPLDRSKFSDQSAVHIVPGPLRGEWGDFSLVEQYLHAFRWCLDHLQFEWIVTLTGLTYPIKPLREFEDTLAGSGQDAFVYHFDAFDKGHWPSGTASNRYLYRYYKLPKFHYWHKVPAGFRSLLERGRNWLNRSQSLVRLVSMPRGARTRLGLRRLRNPFGPTFRLQGGRQMVNVNRHALQSVFDFLSTNPWWIDYCRRTLIPDECFFTTLLVNLPELRVTNDVLRYIKWPTDKAHAASVAVILADEVPDVLRNEAPFALKLDSRIDGLALDLVDKNLGFGAVSS